jgi:hypothetical protein
VACALRFQRAGDFQSNSRVKRGEIAVPCRLVAAV